MAPTYLQLQLFPVLLCLFLVVLQLPLQVSSPGICPLRLLLSSGQLPLQLVQALLQLLLQDGCLDPSCACLALTCLQAGRQHAVFLVCQAPRLERHIVLAGGVNANTLAC